MSPRFVEIAVAVPVFGTFTYRDPRPDDLGRLPVGTQVVVPFGGRTTTGFVVGEAEGPAAGAPIKDVLDVVGDGPLLTADLVDLGRFMAAYYVAPLGEALRTMVPQGEQARSGRVVVLTDEGRRWLDVGQAALPGLADTGTGDRVLLRALDRAGGSMSRRAFNAVASHSDRRVDALVRSGWIDLADRVAARRRGPVEVFWVATARGRELGPGAVSARARARRALWERVLDAGEVGVAAAAASPSARAAAKALAVDGLVDRHERASLPAGAVAERSALAPPTLNVDQAAALAALDDARSRGYGTFVLQGVTGSGKTEVYLRLIASVRRAGRGALVLVPEIALTPQLAERFRARFGDDVAVLHSGLSASERSAAWRRLRSGAVGIALGARSAVFAPVRELGVVVVDEEHESSFKQEEGVRYQARDLAVVRGQKAGAVVVLGSATPSLESLRNVQAGRWTRLLLPKRATPRPLPPVEVIDLRRDPPGPDGLLSGRLVEAIAATLAAGEQTILFLNRRGFATVVLCRACGHVVRCGGCEVSMTYHQGRDRLVCHYCGRTEAPPRSCAACGSPRVEQLGAGTERAEAILRERFGGARIARLDRDTAGQRGERGLEAVLDAMRRGALDILVGTQMVTKGHDFPGVTLVGVLLADQSMHLPDFRASERTFQLLEQVAGRAGRGANPGRVIIQTYSPEHAAIAHVARHDFDGFAAEEMQLRVEADYPPATRMVVLRIDGPTDKAVETVAAAAAAAARAVAPRSGQGAGRGAGAVRVLGPARAPIAKLRGRSRMQVWLASHDRALLAAAARAGGGVPLAAGVRLAVDVDPQGTL